MKVQMLWQESWSCRYFRMIKPFILTSKIIVEPQAKRGGFMCGERSLSSFLETKIQELNSFTNLGIYSSLLCSSYFQSNERCK